jgi:NAD(P)-dependent dehydrogenase (short-subunit alcohol dehydrogenase family)
VIASALGRRRTLEIGDDHDPSLERRVAAGERLGDRVGEFFERNASLLPVGRVGTSEDLGEAIVALLRNGFVTGTVLTIDGGKLLV